MKTTGGSKWVGALLVAAVLLIGIPRAIDLLEADSVRQVLGGLGSLAFFGWLVWRLYAQSTDGWEQEPRFHYVSAAGYAALLTLAILLVTWDVAEDDFRPVLLISPAFMALFVALSLWNARLAAATKSQSKS